MSEKHLEIDFGFVAHIWSGLFGRYAPLFWAQFRYLDNLVISTRRIGCSGSPLPSDPQAPFVPAGLSAQAASSSQVNLAWSASSDNVGVTGYRIYRGGLQSAAGAACDANSDGATNVVDVQLAVNQALGATGF